MALLKIQKLSQKNEIAVITVTSSFDLQMRLVGHSTSYHVVGAPCLRAFLKGLCQGDLADFCPNGYPEISDSQINPFRTLRLNI